MSQGPTAERALFAANDVEVEVMRNGSVVARLRFNFRTEYVRQYALIVAADARNANKGHGQMDTH